MSVAIELETWLGKRVVPESALPLKATVEALAAEIDSPPTNKNGGETSVVPAAREFRAALADLAKACGEAKQSPTAGVIQKAKARRGALRAV